MPFDPIPQISLWAAGTASIAPMIAFAAVLLLLRKRPRAAAGVSIGAVTISLVCAVFLLIRHQSAATPMQASVNWMISGDITIPLGILLDPLSLLMLLVVALICFLVQVYSLGYMAGDPGFSRYYAYMSLFAWAMTALVLSPMLFQLYIFWELVGLASFLLIGFWYEKFSATQAGKKAFIMTRLGDMAFFLGLLLLLAAGGTVNILELNNIVLPGGMSGIVGGVSALLIFGGIIGKSAQFPLLTWLPDAMEGPTPVSALLHSATMVAAGVFLYGRLFPFYSHFAPVAAFTLAIGSISMLLPATMAMVSRDIKQVWAYSTISQLGFMIMGLGAGAYFGGMFHLVTHAGFKALLFLCAGALIHRFHSNDMFEIGRKGGRGMKVPVVCMGIGACALSGIWPFSGFFSKEAVMAGLAGHSNPLWLVLGLAGVFLTAYYTFRLIFVILLPGAVQPAENEHGRAGQSWTDWVMAFALIVLAGVTVLLGFFQAPIKEFLAAGGGHDAGHGMAHGPVWLAPLALGLALLAVALAWVEFGRKGASRVGFVEKSPGLSRLFANRWYMDHIYRWAVDHLLDRGIARLCQKNDDRVVDGSVHLLANSIVACGRAAAGWHRALIQKKLMAVFAVIFGLTLILLIIG
jgi:NADH-quinone oxidoreductase subunit L